MICVSFHSPDLLALSLDKEKYNLVSVFSDEELFNIKLAARMDGENRVLFIYGLGRLLNYAKKRPNRMKKFRVVVFDLPHIFGKHKLDVVDAIKTPIWAPKDVNDSFSELIRKTGKGLKEIL